MSSPAPFTLNQAPAASSSSTTPSASPIPGSSSTKSSGTSRHKHHASGSSTDRQTSRSRHNHRNTDHHGTKAADAHANGWLSSRTPRTSRTLDYHRGGKGASSDAASVGGRTPRTSRSARGERLSGEGGPAVSTRRGRKPPSIDLPIRASSKDASWGRTPRSGRVSSRTPRTSRSESNLSHRSYMKDRLALTQRSLRDAIGMRTPRSSRGGPTGGTMAASPSTSSRTNSIWTAADPYGFDRRLGGGYVRNLFGAPVADGRHLSQEELLSRNLGATRSVKNPSLQQRGRVDPLSFVFASAGLRRPGSRGEPGAPWEA